MRGSFLGGVGQSESGEWGFLLTAGVGVDPRDVKPGRTNGEELSDGYSVVKVL